MKMRRRKGRSINTYIQGVKKIEISYFGCVSWLSVILP